MPEFTGEESVADVVQVALEEFAQRQARGELLPGATLVYKGDIPFLRFHARVKNDLGEFVCFYRLDKMLATVFPGCEVVYDSVAAKGLLGEEPASRERTVRALAYYAMMVMLGRLPVLQLAMFEENFEDTAFVTAGSFLHAYAGTHNRPNVTKVATGGIRDMLSERVDDSAKKKRELLADLLNSLPALHIPTGPGRPQGSTKPVEQKAQEAAEFEQEVENTIKALLDEGGEMPTKTAVAKAMKIGGLNPATGIDSSLAAFRNKLNRLNVDYDAVVKRVKLNE